MAYIQTVSGRIQTVSGRIQPFSGRPELKPVSVGCLKIAENSHDSVHRLGISTQSDVYREVFGSISIFIEGSAPNHDFGKTFGFHKEYGLETSISRIQNSLTNSRSQNNEYAHTFKISR